MSASGPPDDWVVARFSSDTALGTLQSPGAGREVSFALEQWWPCEPAVARALQDSAQRRRLLLPRPGERVAIEWKRSSTGDDRPARITRLHPLPTLPAAPFGAWLRQMAEQVPALAAWGPEEWAPIFRDVDGDLEDAVYAQLADNPERHLAILAWLVSRAPPAVAERRLGWLSLTAEPGAVAVECWGGFDRVFLRLPRELVARLGARGLVLIDESGEG
ncbi:MAG: hypothetical protein JNJ54_01365 [Myxococcaceae bacterium]|nr:hypothetical protein [Myxococcaceae bacterium]